MAFDLKHNRLPPGSLIRICEDYWPAGKRDPLEVGEIGFVIEHRVPARMWALFKGSIEELDFRDAVPITGYVRWIELVSLPEGVRQVEKWYSTV